MKSIYLFKYNRVHMSFNLCYGLGIVREQVWASRAHTRAPPPLARLGSARHGSARPGGSGRVGSGRGAFGRLGECLGVEAVLFFLLKFQSDRVGSLGFLVLGFSVY